VCRDNAFVNKSGIDGLFRPDHHCDNQTNREASAIVEETDESKKRWKPSVGSARSAAACGQPGFLLAQKESQTTAE
jgi:hypothetical protein